MPAVSDDPGVSNGCDNRGRGGRGSMRGDDLVTYGGRARRRPKRRIPARPSIAAGSADTVPRGDAMAANRSLLVRTNPIAGRSTAGGDIAGTLADQQVH